VPDCRINGGGTQSYWKSKMNNDDLIIEAVNRIADTSFDASAPTNTDTSVPTNCNGDRITCPVVLNLLAKPRFFPRPSGSKARGFLDGERKSVEPEIRPKYLGPPSGRIPTDDEKRGAWYLQSEYLAGRLGKDEQENARNWNTVIWINKHHTVTRTPAEALPPLNIYVGDKISQSTKGTGAPTGLDDEAPDKAGNKGEEYEQINIDVDPYNRRGMRVMDEDGTTHSLEIKTDDYTVLRLMDALEEIDDLAAINIDDLGAPILPQTDFPIADQRAESGKIILILMTQMRTLWQPGAIADHATMASLVPGKGKDVAAAVGRQRVIEGLRIAESIRRELGRKERKFSMWQSQTRARQIQVDRPGFSVDDTIKGTLVALADKTPPIVSMPMIGDYEPVMVRQDNDGDTARGSLLAALPDKSLPMPVRALEGYYLNMAAGPVIKIADIPLAGNDNFQSNSTDRKAA
jgi:hypothetical protein